MVRDYPMDNIPEDILRAEENERAAEELEEVQKNNEDANFNFYGNGMFSSWFDEDGGPIRRYIMRKIDEREQRKDESAVRITDSLEQKELEIFGIGLIILLI